MYELTQTIERTILSDSNDPTISTQTFINTPPPGLDIADVWQYVLKSHLLKRFEAASFLPTGTILGIGEGACYRVDRGELNGKLGGKYVAIKYLKVTEHPSRIIDDVEASRSIETVLRELRILTHDPIKKCENIVQLLGYGSRSVGEHLSLYLVVELAAHGTLKDYLEKNKVGVSDKIDFCTGVANGLMALHGCGVANGDVKLENTLVCWDEKEGVIVKLSDFGHSILDDESRYIGTAIFNAPEVRSGRLTSKLRDDYFKCDIFSYGLMVWEILQDGRRYVDLSNQTDPLSWLIGLPKDDLLRLALLAVQKLLPCDASKITLLQTILESTLRDDAEDRKTIQEVFRMLSLEKVFVGKET
ncbi:serine threonine kinase protein [Rutstroemia sp. NJR-2017a WRK4]|nr:serine threonine kinase protein [Rutstroemia sp. NJR-2017a WRK4]